MDLLEAIKERRSVRAFRDTEIEEEKIVEIITAGSFAPSGHNNQPWSFVIVKNKSLKEKIANLTAYNKIVNNANVLIVVFLDKGRSYDRDKDLMAIGACIQNMLLYAHSVGIGTVWLGEILKNKETLREMLEINSEREVMAVIAAGYPLKKPTFTGRLDIHKLILNKK